MRWIAIILMLCEPCQADDGQYHATVKTVASPSLAAVRVTVRGRDSKGQVEYSGCGTTVGPSRVLTCNHIGRGLNEPQWLVNGLAATVVRSDSKADLTLLEVDGAFAFVELATSNAIGQVSAIDQGGVSRSGVTLKVPSPDTTFTTLFLQQGDSGTGLFSNGKLAGVFVGITKDGLNRRIFANVDEVRRFLDASVSSAVPDSLPELWMYSTVGCHWCVVAADAIHVAEDLPFRLVVKHETPKQVERIASGYPFFLFSSTSDKPQMNGDDRYVIGWLGLAKMKATWARNRNR